MDAKVIMVSLSPPTLNFKGPFGWMDLGLSSVPSSSSSFSSSSSSSSFLLPPYFLRPPLPLPHPLCFSSNLPVPCASDCCHCGQEEARNWHFPRSRISPGTEETVKVKPIFPPPLLSIHLANPQNRWPSEELICQPLSRGAPIWAIFSMKRKGRAKKVRRPKWTGRGKKKPNLMGQNANYELGGPNRQCNWWCPEGTRECQSQSFGIWGFGQSLCQSCGQVQDGDERRWLSQRSHNGRKDTKREEENEWVKGKGSFRELNLHSAVAFLDFTIFSKFRQFNISFSRKVKQSD